MAQTITFPIIPSIEVPGAYLIVEGVDLSYINHTAYIRVAIYRNEQVRRDGTEPVITPDRRVINKFVDHELFNQFFTDEKLLQHDNSPKRAAYALLSSYSEPHGMRELFLTGREV